MSSNNLSISSIALDLSGAIETANKDLNAIFAFTGHLMAAAESFGASLMGSVKKNAVMAKAKQFAESLGHTWSAIQSSVSTFIDNVKSAYNTVTQAVGA